MKMNGFASVRLPKPQLIDAAKAVLKHHSPKYGLMEDANALMLTWKNTPMIAVSAWRLAC